MNLGYVKFAWAVATAGLWPILLSYGIGVIAAAAFGAAAWFSPVFKKTFLALAVAFAAVTAGYGVGVHQGERRGEERVTAQWQASVEAQIEKSKKARAHAERTVKRGPGWLHHDRKPNEFERR